MLRSGTAGTFAYQVGANSADVSRSGNVPVVPPRSTQAAPPGTGEPGPRLVVPPVVAVVVTCDAGPWLEEALAALARQDYPNLSVLVVDAASASDPTSRVASVLPGAYVRRLDTNPGWATAANEVLHIVEGASHFVFLHDDAAPDADAVRLLVEEAYRSNAGVVAAKLVDWEDPRRLLAVGMTADKAGVVVPFGRGELDQEQHDAVRDVFVAPGGCFLVRADLFASLGGFDPTMVLFGDDLDLSWRAQVLGARVVVAPAARARHLEASRGAMRQLQLVPDDDVDAEIADRIRPLERRHRLRTLLKVYGWFHLLRVLPQVALMDAGQAIFALLSGQRRAAGAIAGAWRWNLAHLGELRAARRPTQKQRRLSDGDVRRLQARGSARFTTFVRGQLGIGGRASAVAAAGRQLAGAVGRDGLRPAVMVWTAVTIVLIFGSRVLLTERIPAIGQLAPFPSGPGTFFRLFFSGWRLSGLGSEYPAPPAFALLGLGGVVVFGSMGALRTLLVLGALPVGLVGIWRLTGPLRSPRARLVAVVLYAACPLPYDSLARGRFGGLVAFAAMPWILSRLMWATGLAPFTARRTPVASASARASVPRLVAVPVGVGPGQGASLLPQPGEVAPPGAARRGDAADVLTDGRGDAADVLTDGRGDAADVLADDRGDTSALLSGRGDVTDLLGAEAGTIDSIAAGEFRLAAAALAGAGERMPSPTPEIDRDPPAVPPPALGRQAWPAAILMALAAALVPAVAPVALVAAVGLVIGSVLAGGASRALRSLMLAGVALAIAAALLFPWSLQFLLPGGSWSALLGTGPPPAGSPSFSQVVRFHAGARSAGPLQWALLVVAALPLVIGRGWRLAWATRLWTVALVCWALAWAAGRGWLGVAPPAMEVLLAPAGVALAVAGALGLVAFEVDLPGYRFGWRQAASLAAALALGVATFPVLGQSLGGRWGTPEHDFAGLLSWMPERRDEGAFRVLWVGHPHALPLEGWPLDESLAYGLSRGGPPDATALWPAPDRHPTRLVANALDVARRGETTHLGRMLAPMAVRYLVVPQQLAPAGGSSSALPVPGEVVDALRSQIDLRLVETDEGVVLFENTEWGPARAVLTARGVEASRGRGRDAPGASLKGSRSVLLEERGPASFRGEVPGDSEVYLSEASSPRWELRAGGEIARRQEAFGWANSFTVERGGPARLWHRPAPWRYAAWLAQAAVWVVVLRFAARRSGGRLPTPPVPAGGSGRDER